VNRPAHFGNILPRTRNGSGVNIRSMQFEPGEPGRDGGPRRAGPATEINNNNGGSHRRRGRPLHRRTDLGLVNRVLGQESHSLLDEELGAAARNENADVELNPQAPEFCPAQNVLQRMAGNALLHEGGDISRTPRGIHEQPRLILGKHTAGQPKPIRDGGNGFEAHSGAWHGNPFQ
jgi:hypothetical protein